MRSCTTIQFKCTTLQRTTRQGISDAHTHGNPLQKSVKLFVCKLYRKKEDKALWQYSGCII